MRKAIIMCGLAAALLAGCGGSSSPTAPGPTGPTVSVNDVNVNEPGTASFTVTLSAAASGNVIFSFGTGGGTATTGADYTATSGSDTILAGATTATVLVPILDDATAENTETFNLTISGVTGATNGDLVGTANILPNDGFTAVSFAANVRPILTGNCAVSGCHGSGSTSGGMTMGSATWSEIRAASGLNGVIVIAFNANSSNLYLKTTLTPPFGSRMPFGRTPLTIEQQEAIRDWISQGALNN